MSGEERKVYEAFDRVQAIRSPYTEFHAEEPPDTEPEWLKEEA